MGGAGVLAAILPFFTGLIDTRFIAHSSALFPVIAILFGVVATVAVITYSIAMFVPKRIALWLGGCGWILFVVAAMLKGFAIADTIPA
jgi:hypothetical protein